MTNGMVPLRFPTKTPYHPSRKKGPHPMTTDVAVVIVNYGTADMAIAAVDSVLNRPQDSIQVEVHLVDNASPGNDAQVFRQTSARWGDAVTLYLEKTNHGFGRGNNVVLRQLAQRASPPDKVYMLNPDARLVTNAVAELSAFLDRHPKAGMVGSGILEEATGDTAASAFRFPNPFSEFISALNFGPLTRLLGKKAVAFPHEQPAQQVDWVSGASMMARLTALSDVNFFDPDFFLYFEEVDLMHRLKRKGWEVWHDPAVKVMHVEGASTGVNSENPERPPLPPYWYDSWRMYFEKQNGRTGARTAAFARLAGTVMGELIEKLRRKPKSNPRNFVPDFWRHVVTPLLQRNPVRKSI